MANLIPILEGVYFDLIEPLDHFFKDEVSARWASLLACQENLCLQQPFPGPGLVIRIIMTLLPEKLDLRNADAIVRRIDYANAQL